MKRTLKEVEESEKRLSNLVNLIREENEELRAKTQTREYVFAPEALTSEEQAIIGDYIDTPIIDLLNKWFKQKADTNNDLLVHNSDPDPVKEAKYKLAVLMYDDWRMLLVGCQKAFDKNKS